MKNYEEIKNYLLNNVNEIGSIVSEINCIDGSLEFLEYWNNDEEFFNTFFYNNPMEAVRAEFYGDYNFCDDYVTFDGYGNLKSVDDYELEKEYKYYIEDIVESLLDHYKEINISDDNLNELIEKYIKEIDE